MKIRILSVGKVKEVFYRNRIQEYAGEIQRKWSLEILEVADEGTAEHMSEAEVRTVLKTEGERLLNYLPPNREELVIALCIDGASYSAQEWMEHIQVQVQRQSITQLTFVIGGSLGLDPAVVRRADQKLSFSRLTFPHQLMRVLLV